MADLIRDDLTTQVVGKALDGWTERAKVIAQNIANVDTPNFKASELLFEEQLQAALRAPTPHLAMRTTHTGHIDVNRASRDVSGVFPQVHQLVQMTLRNDGNNVDIEREMERLAETQLSFQAMTRFMNDRFNRFRTAIREGRS